MRRVLAPICAASVLLAAAPAVLCAQQVRGRVVDGVAARPIAGVVVSAFDTGGRSLGRTLSDDSGAFRLAAPAAVRLQLQRLGYRPRELRLPAAVVRDTLLADLALQPIPLAIGPLHVRESQICKPRADDAQVLALWEQARSGLLASVVAAEARPATMRLLLFDRTRDARADTVVTQSTQLVAASSTRAFYAADSARGFAHRGYMVADGADRRRYFAPDADVLLDPAFGATHCFRIVQGQGDHADEVGLGFAPAASRSVDVEGTLWIDPRTPALRTLEFSYTGVDPQARSAHSGGRLRFATLRNGMTFIDDWLIRVGRGGYVDGDRFARLLDVQEHGGMIVSAVWPDSTSWTSALPRVAGDVATKGARSAARGIRVSLRGTDLETTTDAHGHFELGDVLPGPYELRAIDADLAPFDIIDPVTRRIIVGDSTPAAMHLEVPSRTALAAELCDADRASDSASTILLRVVDTAGQHAKAADVIAEWTPPGVNQQAASGAARAGSADSEGRVVLCALPRRQALRLRARNDGGFLADTAIQLADSIALATLELRLKRPASPAIARAAEEAFARVPHASGRWSAHSGNFGLTLQLEQDGSDVSGLLDVANDMRPAEARTIDISGELRGDTLVLRDGQSTLVDGVIDRDRLAATVSSALWDAAARLRQGPAGQRLVVTDGPTVHFWRVQRQ